MAEGAVTFDKKWGERWHRFGFEGESGTRMFRKWWFEKYNWTPDSLAEFLAQQQWILDAGCGTGHDVAMFADMTDGVVYGLDLSAATCEVATQNVAHLHNAKIFCGDILNPPFEPESFDFIAAEGVLHHTPSTKGALESLVRLLRTGGTIQFYIYKKKVPLRELADDYLRGLMSTTPFDICAESCKGITALGKALSELHATIYLPPIPVLGVEGGKYDLQRFIYYHFLKCFWNDEMSFDENNLVNVDWYHPQFAHRHTPSEVLEWCREFRLSVSWLDVGESGIAVRAVKHA